VWVVAELLDAPATPPAPGSPPSMSVQPLRGRAHLLVTVPLYMNWFTEDTKQ